MNESADFRSKEIVLERGRGRMPALGFGTLIPDAATTVSATRDALKAGYRHFDCAERYRNEREVGEALRVELAAEGIAREDIFVTTKLWPRLSRSLSDSHAVRISTRRRAGPAR